MDYTSLTDCLQDLERTKQLVRVKECVDTELEMAAIHLRVHEKRGPALLFENVRGCKYKAVSNLFGTLERSKYIFREHFTDIQKLIELKNDPAMLLKNPFRFASLGLLARKSLPKKISGNVRSYFDEIRIRDLPQIKHWPGDGGAFVTLPQVYSEDVDQPGVQGSNLGMYRIQLNGNDYVSDQETGLHYQLHRGIGIHQAKANKKNASLKVSVFVGGPPAHTLAAIMPLPEGISELGFAGVLGGRRFRYMYSGGYCISMDADFVILGEVLPGENKEEGPFGDHLGYYSMKHLFPVMRVHKVLAKKRDATWPFTVVGRPPQEDTAFGALIHELTGHALSHEVPGLKAINAVDAAGVHPLLLAVGSERYTPYLDDKKPSELLTIANRILGTGQLSLAKYLFITCDDTSKISVDDIPGFFVYCLERIDLTRDLHFQTQTSIDTLDYSGAGLNSGSKLVLAAYGNKKRELCRGVPEYLQELHGQLILPGIIAVRAEKFISYEKMKKEVGDINEKLKGKDLEGVMMLVLCEDVSFVCASLNNFLWVTFTRSNPSHDVHGIGSFTENKHWGCIGPVVIDARVKPGHAPALEKDSLVEERVEKIVGQGGSLFGVL